MLVILKPAAFQRAHCGFATGTGALDAALSRFLTPHSTADLPTVSAAIWAANGVLLREPLNPCAPLVDQAKVLLDGR